MRPVPPCGCCVEIPHGTLDAVGMAVIVTAVTGVIADGPAHLEIECAIDADAFPIWAIGVFSECRGCAVVDLAEDQSLFGSSSESFA